MEILIRSIFNCGKEEMSKRKAILECQNREGQMWWLRVGAQTTHLWVRWASRFPYARWTFLLSNLIYLIANHQMATHSIPASVKRG